MAGREILQRGKGRDKERMVEGGFEPPKCETEDLKSSPFDLALVLNQERDKEGGGEGRNQFWMDRGAFGVI